MENQPNQNELFEIAQTQDIAGFKAMALLAKLNDTIYPPFLPDMETTLTLPLKINNWQDVKTKTTFNIDVTPNPADKYAVVNVISKIPRPFKMELTNTQGVKVFEESYSEGTEKVRISTELLLNGTYVLTVVSSSQMKGQ